MTFSRKPARKIPARRILSPLALAALAGAGLAGAHAPAMAQKAPQGTKAPKSAVATAPAKANYSKEFVAAYKPIEAQATAAGADYAALKAVVPTLVAAATTPDDKLAAGRMIFTIGQKSTDYPLTLQGAEMMLASGRADATQVGPFSFVAAQLAYNLKDYAKARTYVEAAIKAGYTANDPELLLAETYFAQQQHAAGIKYLTDIMAARKAAGQPVSEAWVKRALATAYNNKLYGEARQLSLVYARDFPNQSSWGDAIAIAINTGNYANPEMLDLLRLARRTNTIRTRAQYLEYIESADARKLPNEVIQVLDAGVAAKLVDPSVQMVKDTRAAALARIAADKAELPALQRAADGSSAKLVTVMAAADALLSYGKYAEAEAYYARAAGMPGANLPLALTRQAIAQVEQGKYAEAQATLAKVQGPRQPISNLWALYAAQKAAGTTIAPAPASTIGS